MHALDWMTESSGQPIQPVYAIFGSDAYLIRESINGVVRAVFPESDGEAAVSRFPRPQTELADVLEPSEFFGRYIRIGALTGQEGLAGPMAYVAGLGYAGEARNYGDLARGMPCHPPTWRNSAGSWIGSIDPVRSAPPAAWPPSCPVWRSRVWGQSGCRSPRRQRKS